MVEFEQCFIILFYPKMVENADLRRAEQILHHLNQVKKAFTTDKLKLARDLLLQQALAGESGSLDAVQSFKQDSRVCHQFSTHAMLILQGQMTRARYTMCLGLLTARLMFW